ncbi:oxidoreductase [Penicillium daleae]|uniref:Oxidoreductase n=1 Tax=Penicillium daleae TaxID=63821 RepID=A0AAD6FZ84_9EURO|nr:oxidoreductase [Penicillium daleae]KAJ5439633.1 oxidoreductase [Penicillium daleae]
MEYVLITGCSDGGIGSALAQSFHDKGLYVFATARDISKIQNLRDLANITFLQLDVTSPASIATAYKIVENETNGKLHYLINNSGAGFVMPLLDSDIEMGQRMFDVNVWGVVRVTQTFAPLVVNAKGTVVNNVSTAARVGLPYQAAIRLMSETLALEMKPLGVKVVIVITGNIRTRWFVNSPRLELPEGSYYSSIVDRIEIFARGEQGHPQMESKVYAEKVVGDVHGGAKETIWRGAQSTIVRIAMAVIPTWLLVTVKVPPREVIGSRSEHEQLPEQPDRSP